MSKALHSVRPIRIEGDLAYVSLSQGYEAVIDASDAPLVADFNWYAMIARRHDGEARNIYAVRMVRVGKKQKALRMHRVIARTPEEFQTDHRDGNGLNNRRDNLRSATAAENQRNARLSSVNTSGFKGVTWDKARGKWRSHIKVFGGTQYLGLFDDATTAGAAYATASARLHGEFGRTA